MTIVLYAVREAYFMERMVTLIAVASVAFAFASPALAQGRYGEEAKQRARERAESESIRRIEHPELYEKAAEKPAAPAREAAPAAAEPAAAAPVPAAPAPAQ
jgi:hypothetical protein